ncbi:MAG: hypothetical protein AB1384_13155 [Actinomycetota bacterium]
MEGAAARIGVGLIALGAPAAALVDSCRDRLETYFSSTFAAFEWRVDREDWDLQWADPVWLLDRAQARMEEAGWQFSFLVADPGVHGAKMEPATLSFSHSAAIVYPAGGVEEANATTGVETVERCCRVIITSFARLNGLPHLEERSPKGRGPEGGDPLSPKETEELESALRSLTDGILKRGVKEIKGLALYARIIFSHPMRVLRTVLSHRPLRMVFSLGKLVFASMAALVLALLSTELWYLGVGINIWRLVLIAIAVLLASTLYVVFRQQLYVRRVSRSLSEQAAFFNLTSFLTIFGVLLALFIIIFVITILVTVGAYPRYIIEDWVMRSEVDFFDYMRVSLLISSMAMVVGALGAGLEENQYFRQVMYAERNR